MREKIKLGILTALIVLLAIGGTAWAGSGNPGEEDLPPLIKDAGPILTLDDLPHLEEQPFLRGASRLREVELSSWAYEPDKVEVGDRFTLNLFPDVSYVATVYEVHDHRATDGPVVRARLSGPNILDTSSVRLRSCGERVTATANIYTWPADVHWRYRIYPDPQTNKLYVAEVNVDEWKSTLEPAHDHHLRICPYAFDYPYEEQSSERISEFYSVLNCPVCAGTGTVCDRDETNADHP